MEHEVGTGSRGTRLQDKATRALVEARNPASCIWGSKSINRVLKLGPKACK